jgi:hypothetical protein
MLWNAKKALNLAPPKEGQPVISNEGSTVRTEKKTQKEQKNFLMRHSFNFQDSFLDKSAG